MDTVILERFYDNGTETIGRLFVPSCLFSCYTIERPWKDNERMRSCIPATSKQLEDWEDGTPYMLTRKTSPRFGEVFGVEGNGISLEPDSSADRDLILIHVANYAHEVVGCIGVGRNVQAAGAHTMVTHSRITHNALMDALSRDVHHYLYVVDYK